MMVDSDLRLFVCAKQQGGEQGENLSDDVVALSAEVGKDPLDDMVVKQRVLQRFDLLQLSA